jgi:hypothetical protein
MNLASPEVVFFIDIEAGENTIFDQINDCNQQPTDQSNQNQAEKVAKDVFKLWGKILKRQRKPNCDKKKEPA